MHAPRAPWLLLLLGAAAWAGCAPIWPDLDAVVVGKNLSVPRNGGFVPEDVTYCELQFTGYNTAPAGMVRYPRFDSFNITGDGLISLYDWNGYPFYYRDTDRPINMTASRVGFQICNITRVPGFRAVYVQSPAVKCKNNTVVYMSGSGGYFASPTPAGPGVQHVAPYHCGWNITLTGVGPEYTAVELTVYMNEDGDGDGYVLVSGPNLGSEGGISSYSASGDTIYFRTNALVSYAVDLPYYGPTPIGMGFRAFWKPVRLCTVGMNVSVGAVIAPWPDAPENWSYTSPGDTCTWVVNAPPGERILLILTISSDPWPSYDFQVTVHDGDNESAPCIFTTFGSGGGAQVIRSSNATLFVKSEIYDLDQVHSQFRFRGETSILGDQQLCDRCTFFEGDRVTYYNGNPEKDEAYRLEGQTCAYVFTPTAGAYGVAMNLTTNITVSEYERTRFLVGNQYETTVSNDCFYCSNLNTMYNAFSGTYLPVTLAVTMNPPNYLCSGCTYYGGAFKLSFASLMPVQCSGQRVIVGPTAIANPNPSMFNTRYLNNSDCLWVVYGGGHLMPIVSMYFYAMDLAPGCGDRITVHDGDSETAPVLATLCGNQTGLVTASGGAMAVKFISDAGNEASGFSAQTQCHGIMLVGDGIQQSGDIYNSPLAPHDGLYATNSTCTWIIRVPDNYKVDLSGSYDLAVNDTLVAYDGDSMDYQRYNLRRSYNYVNFASSRNVLIVVWTSPHTDDPAAAFHHGLSIHWAMYDDNCDAFLAWSPQGPGIGPVQRAAWVQAPSAYNGVKLATTQNSSVVFTPESPQDNIMYIPLGVSMGAGNVSLYAVGASQPLAVFTGSGARLPLINLGAVSNISAIELVYSPAAVAARGFLGLFLTQQTDATCAPLETVAVSTERVITVPRTGYGAMDYEPSAYCFQVLTVSSGRVGLNITEMDIQPSGYCMADALEVYDGGDPSAPKIGSYCGQAPPTMIVGSTTSLLLVFRSDGFFTQYKGFSAIIGPTTLPATTGATGMTTDATTTLPPVTTAPGTGTLTSTLTSTTDATSTSTSTTGDGGVSEINNGKTGFDAFLGMLGGNMLYVLIGVGALVLICICALIIVCVRRRRRGGYNPESTVQLDLMQTTMKASFDSGMKARVEGLLKAGSTKKIGTGGTAKVYRAEMDGKMVALKVLSEKTVKASLEFHREANILSRLTTTTNSHVIQLMFFCDDPPCLVCELAENGSLSGIRSEFKSYAADKQKDILFQVSEGMEFLHANSIVHLDLKPDNVLLGVGGVCKVSDFGSSAILGEDLDVSFDGLTAVRDFNGTPQYASPERFRLRMKIDMKKADVFSFGVMAWSLISGEAPYTHESAANIMSNYSAEKEVITVMPLDMSVLSGVDSVYAGITRECMEAEFRRRPSFVDISSMLRGNTVDVTRVAVNSASSYGSGLLDASYNPAFDSYNTSANGSFRGNASHAGSLRGPASPPPGGGHPRTGSNAEPPSRPSRAGSAADQRPANYPRSASATRPGPPPPPPRP